jgi:hypothetical protein
MSGIDPQRHSADAANAGHYCSLLKYTPAAEELKCNEPVDVTISQIPSTYLARCAERKGTTVLTGVAALKYESNDQRYAAKISIPPRKSTDRIRAPPSG